MDQEPGIDVLKIELLAHSCCKHDRKFQSLAFVDRHDLHRATSRICQIDLAEIHLVFLKFLNIADKVKQSTVTCLLIIHRFFDQHMEVCASLCTARERLRISTITCLFEDVHDKLMDRCIRRHIPDHVKLFQKSAEFFSEPDLLFLFFLASLIFLRISADAVVDHPFRTFTSNHCKLLCITSDDRGMQNTCQRDILKRIVADSQIIQKRHHFLRGKISRSGCRIDRDPSGAQNLAERL